MTVRELQSHVLRYCARQQLNTAPQVEQRIQHFQQMFRSRLIKNTYNAANRSNLSTQGLFSSNTPISRPSTPQSDTSTVSSALSTYIKTPGNSPIYQSLRGFLDVHNLQMKDHLPRNIGLNGFLITGSAGLGKSALVETLLTEEQYTEISAEELQTPSNGTEPYTSDRRQFFKLDVNLPLSTQKELLIQAMSLGVIVWIDEINAILDSGIEKDLNALLTGLHPDLKTPLPHPGKIIMTANGADLPGRALISPAIHARSITHSIPLPEINDIHRLLTHRYPTLSETDLNTLSREMREQLNDPDFNLRDLLSRCDACFPQTLSPTPSPTPSL